MSVVRSDIYKNSKNQVIQGLKSFWLGPRKLEKYA